MIWRADFSWKRTTRQNHKQNLNWVSSFEFSRVLLRALLNWTNYKIWNFMRKKSWNGGVLNWRLKSWVHNGLHTNFFSRFNKYSSLKWYIHTIIYSFIQNVRIFLMLLLFSILGTLFSSSQTWDNWYENWQDFQFTIFCRYQSDILACGSYSSRRTNWRD